MQQHLKKKRTENHCQTTKTTEKGVYGCVFLPTYREALCDRNFYIEEKDSGSESCTDSDGLLGIAEHTAHTAGDQVCNPHKARLNLSKSFFCLLHLDDVHSGDCQANMVSCCRPVQRFIV